MGGLKLIGRHSKKIDTMSGKKEKSGRERERKLNELESVKESTKSQTNQNHALIIKQLITPPER